MIFGILIVILVNNADKIFPSEAKQLNNCIRANKCPSVGECGVTATDPEECRIDPTCVGQCRSKIIDYTFITKPLFTVYSPFLAFGKFAYSLIPLSGAILFGVIGAIIGRFIKKKEAVKSLPTSL